MNLIGFAPKEPEPRRTKAPMPPPQMSKAGLPENTPKPPRPRVRGEQPPESKELPPRLLQIGVDMGTCWSKIVVRDYEASSPLAFVVRPLGKDKGPKGDFRIPSAVTLLDESLFFGWPGDAQATKPGAVVYTSVKMRAAFPEAPEYENLPKLPKGLDPEDLATLVATYLLQIASDASVRYAGGLKPKHQPKPGVSLGVPMGLVADPQLQERFVAIIRTALELVKMEAPAFTEGLAVSRAISLLKEARSRLKGRKVRDPRDWVRSEAEAGLLWIFESPRVAPGLYGCIDVGAGTTDVSIFRIAQGFDDGVWRKARLVFYSALSGMPGVDAIDDLLCSGGVLSRSNVRGRQDDFTMKLNADDRRSVLQVTKQMWEVCQEAWREGYRKAPLQSVWEPLKLFVLGGGGKLADVRDSLKQTPWPLQLADRVIVANEYPPDLYEIGARGSRELFSDDPNFMLVAYGLSFMGTDVPPADAPEEGAEFAPPHRPRRSIDQDEFYPK